jgi:hypothetical protein
MDVDKVHETRCRRMAERQGYRITRSRSRDRNALTFGEYQIIDAETGTIAFCDWNAPRGYGLDLDDVEEWLKANKDDRPVGPSGPRPIRGRGGRGWPRPLKSRKRRHG